MNTTSLSTQTGYDQVAEEYAVRFENEMTHKPFDRKMLDWLAEKVNGLGVLCDMGCGPGQIARYLHAQSVSVCGIDLSPEMVGQAQAFNPEIAFQQGDMLDLSEVADNAFGGIAAFYSIIHTPRPQLAQVFQELKRVLQPSGILLLTFHIGQEVRHFDEWWGKAVSLDFFFFETAEIKEELTSAGFVLQEVIERDPYPDIEVQTRRAYIFTQKP